MELKVPEDLSIIGFGNDPLAVTTPALTTIDIQKNELGKKAVKQLLKRIKYPGTAWKNIKVPTRLVERGTVCKAKKAGGSKILR